MGGNFDDSKRPKLRLILSEKIVQKYFFYPSYFAFFNENRGREDLLQKYICILWHLFIGFYISSYIIQYWCTIRIYRNSTTVEKRSSTM